MLMNSTPSLSGMKAFLVVQIGQVFSLIGTSMSGVAMTIWAYQETESVTALALVGISFITPMLIASPFAGALVDRHNRKLMMMLSDLAAGAATIGIFLLYTTGMLEIWHLYIAGVIQGTFAAFQWPAFSAAISTMLPKEQYGRANGMIAMAESATGILGPILAGALLGLIGLGGVLLIDIVTFVIAVLALLVVHIPQPRRSAAGIEGQGNIFKEAFFGFHYIVKRPSLLSLQLVFLFANLMAGLAITAQAPMILARTDSNELIFGTVNSIGAAGAFVGGMLMSAWGGPKRRVHGVLGGWLIYGLVSLILLGLGRSLPVWGLAVFLGSLVGPIINSSNQAIWQAKVPPDVQGRVFSIRRMIAWFATPLSALAAGALADRWLEPAMRSSSTLSSVFSPLVGNGPGAGMSLLIIFAGILVGIVSVTAYFLPIVRHAEILLPDHDAVPAPSMAD
jgi:MFS transporter, DHA3 family, macrolide efflux protein